ncbi:MAG: hypothetical protein B6I26_03025 [Desulfobacteraceae bacterium 4572_130]|nr:MAG: hypothetical protein B6I26_03025 [Desulfobacteraceae bacterium 4572_130]
MNAKIIENLSKNYMSPEEHFKQAMTEKNQDQMLFDKIGHLKCKAHNKSPVINKTGEQPTIDFCCKDFATIVTKLL